MTLRKNNRLTGSKANVRGNSKLTPRDKNSRRGKSSTIAVKAFDSIEAAIGGRDAVVEALAVADLTDEQNYLFGLIADPRNDARSLASICAKANYTLGHLLQLFKDAKLARAQVEAISKVASELPTVAVDVMTLAKITEEPCPRCAGKGQIVSEPDEHGEITDITCEDCHGKGSQTYTPGIERQKLALELGGLYSRSTGVQIANVFAPVPSNELGGRITPDYLKDMRMGTDRLLYPGRSAGIDTSEAIDAEIIDAKVEQTQQAVETPEAGVKSESETNTETKPAPISSVDQAGRAGRVDTVDLPSGFLPPSGARPPDPE